MADSPWQAWIEILPDFKGFDAKANQGVTGALGAAGAAGSVSFGKSFLGGVGAVFGGTALTQLAFGAGRVIGDAISSAVNFGLDGIQLASSLGEQANAVKVSFGPVSDEILALAQDAPKNLNITRASFDRLAVRFQSFARTIAGNGGNVSSVIDKLTKRGADFASVYDIDVSDALDLFQSGLAGEIRPLREYGIDISEATVKAFAYANGIAAQGSQLTDAQKIQARYGAILQQTDQVQGDLANTSGTLANQQRQLKVGFEEAQTALGEALLPAFTKIVGFANDTLIPKFSEVIDVVGPKIADALDKAAPAFERVTEKAGPLLDKLVSMGTDALPGFLDGFGQVVDAAPAWVDAFAWANDPNAQPAKFLNDLNDAITNFKPFGDKGLIGGLFDDKPDLPVGLDSSTTAWLTGQGSKAGTIFTDSVSATISGNALAITTATTGAIDGAVVAGQLHIDIQGATLGKAFSDGMTRGIQNGAGATAAAGRALAAAAVEAAKKRLDSHSPSKVMEGLGDDTVQGYINPLKDRVPDVEKAMQDLIAIPTVPNVTPPTSLASSEARPTFIDPSQMQELIDALHVDLLTNDTLLASSSGRGSGFQTALGAG